MTVKQLYERLRLMESDERMAITAGEVRALLNYTVAKTVEEIAQKSEEKVMEYKAVGLTGQEVPQLPCRTFRFGLYPQASLTVGGENIETAADYETRKEVDREKAEAEARKEELRRRIVEEAEYLRREVRRVEAIIRTAEREVDGADEDALFRYLDLLESVKEDFGID